MSVCLRVSCGVCCVLLIGVGWAGGRTAGAADRTGASGFDLQRFDEFKNLTPVERARRGVAFLKEESARPSPDALGFHAHSIIDHDYVQANMAAMLAAQGPSRQELEMEYARLRTGEVKDGVAVTLGLMGDRAVLPHLVNLLSRQGYLPHLRSMAAHALERMPDPQVIPYAAQILATDRTAGITYRLHPGTRVLDRKVRDYFVRTAALRLLKKLEKAGLYIKPEIQSIMEGAILEETLARYRINSKGLNEEIPPGEISPGDIPSGQ